MKVLKCTDSALAEAAAVLMRGGVAVIPTDTVYGLAAHPGFPAAVDRLYTIKGRAAKKPITLLASDVDAVVRFLGGSVGEAAPPPLHAGRGVFPKSAADLVERHWPGGLTLVLPKGGAYEGLRVPDHGWTRRLIAMCGGVLRVTSANLSGRRAATDAPQALAEVGLSADLVVDGGVSPGGVASTVVKVDPDGTTTVLRQGAVGIC